MTIDSIRFGAIYKLSPAKKDQYFELAATEDTKNQFRSFLSDITGEQKFDDYAKDYLALHTTDQTLYILTTKDQNDVKAFQKYNDRFWNTLKTPYETLTEYVEQNQSRVSYIA